MKRFLVLAAASVTLLLTGYRSPESEFRYNYENILGTSFELKVSASNEKQAETAEIAALNEIDRLDAILSSYKPNSEFSRWQKTFNQDVQISAELFEVLELFDEWRINTGNILNPAVAVAADLWKTAAVSGTAPRTQDLERTVLLMSEKQWELNNEKSTARRLTTTPLLLNTFVKSYVIEKVSKVVSALPGVNGAVINIGGDIVVAGEISESVRISDPNAHAENDQPVTVVRVKKKTIATSGDYRRGYVIGEKWYSHILDPRTGFPANAASSVTVISDKATDAGALATAFNILTPDECAILLKQLNMEDVQYRIQTRAGEIFESQEWRTFETSNATVKNALPKNGDNELTIDIELASFQGRVRRPYVAIWIEDKKKEPVRNLALWYNKPRWLPDLKRWYNKNHGVIDDNTASSVTSATRSPGKYTLKWDGLDDKGNKLQNGVYTIYIEAAREHGTYQLMRQEFEWNGKPKHINIKGGVEITGASLDIHKISAAK